MEFQRNKRDRNMVIAVWFLVQNVFYISILLCICLLIPSYLDQRGLLLVVNWELVTVLVYRVVSRGLTCVETGFKD